VDEGKITSRRHELWVGFKRRIEPLLRGVQQIDEVRSGGYHISQGDFRVHFGLGHETRADVTIRWPQGTIETISGVDANQWITVREGKGIVERRHFANQADFGSRLSSGGQ
jgi:hypothetical protein